jgi:hypothetical protein
LKDRSASPGHPGLIEVVVITPHLPASIVPGRSELRDLRLSDEAAGARPVAHVARGREKNSDRCETWVEYQHAKDSLFGIVSRVREDAGEDEALDAVCEGDWSALLVCKRKLVVEHVMSNSVHELPLHVSTKRFARSSAFSMISVPLSESVRHLPLDISQQMIRKQAMQLTVGR